MALHKMGETYTFLPLFSKNFQSMKTPNLKKLYTYYQMMKFEKLIGTGEHLLKRYPENQHLLNILGLAYDQHAVNLSELSKRERYQKKAISYFNTLLKIDPESPKALRGLGLVALHQNKLTSALTYYKKAYALDKKDISNFSSLGNVYRRMRNYTQALFWYKKCLAMKRLRGMAYFNIASLYKDQNRSALAKQYARLGLKSLEKYDDTYPLIMKKKLLLILEEK